MTFDELREFMKDENNKTEFYSLIGQLGFKSQEDITGLENKKNELLGELRKEKDKRIEIEKKLDNFDYEGYKEYVSSKDEKDGKQKDYNLTKLETKLTEEKDKYTKLESKFFSILKEINISKAMEENGIDPRHKKILTSAFNGKALVEQDGDNFLVSIEDEGGLRLPTDDFFKKWITTDNGKTYLKQAEQRGGGNSSFSHGSQDTIKRSEFQKLPATEQMSLINKGVKPID
ncbi:MAG: hypothetical protein PVF17_00765 [Ignavibacteria bacterium]|jgi:hypothetical protein